MTDKPNRDLVPKGSLEAYIRTANDTDVNGGRGKELAECLYYNEDIEQQKLVLSHLRFVTHMLPVVIPVMACRKRI